MVKIGFEYGRSMTGEEISLDLDQCEEPDLSVPDPQENTLVAMTSEVRNNNSESECSLCDFRY
jgi:hypothetical protein